MSSDFVMPTLGADMEAGTLAAWWKKPGDVVKRGEVIADVETDKGVIEVEVFTDGVVEQLLVQPGEQVPVGTVMARIREHGEERGQEEVPPPAEGPTARPPAPAPETPPATGPRKAALPERVAASPAARRRAQELGIALERIQGTGPGGAVTLDDVERAASAQRQAPSLPAAAPPSAMAGESDRVARMRQTIAAAMTRSKREIPHYYLTATIDMAPAMNWLTTYNRDRPIAQRILPGVPLIKAVALALHETPELNAIWSGNAVRLQERIHVGMVIALR